MTMITIDRITWCIFPQFSSVFCCVKLLVWSSFQISSACRSCGAASFGLAQRCLHQRHAEGLLFPSGCPKFAFQSAVLLVMDTQLWCIMIYWKTIYIYIYMSSTAQGGGGSFKNRKPIGEVGCCESGMAERSHWWIERCLISLSLSFSFCLYIYLSIDRSLSIYVSMYLCIYLSIYPSIDPSIDLSIYLTNLSYLSNLI